MASPCFPTVLVYVYALNLGLTRPEKRRGTKNLPDFWVIPRAENSLLIRPSDPRDEDWFLPFLGLKWVSLEVHLAFKYL